MSRRAYTPRAYAPLAMQHFRDVPRCALFAKPGMGKTTLVATHLDIAYNVWGDTEPTLVLGPKRVAQDVWTDEVQKWKHLSGLEIASVTGTEDERIAALKRDVPVFAMNYENLPWLRETLGPKRWPFRRVVADESTRLKNFRYTQGGARARALGQVAHHMTREWIELTGTPSPNGLKDLWGQIWFLDKGERLGLTYKAFEDRWFGWKRVKDALTHKPGIEPVIFPFAQEQIQELLKDICLSLDPKDYFDIKDPIPHTIEVDLPTKARAHYRELEKDLFTQLEGLFDVEVFNAAGLSLKCLQFANGAVYTDDKGAWRTVHDEKLDALESIVEENGGEPVLTAYHFKSDLARLLKRFPDALDLSTDAGMAAAKAGRGALWLGHPASMGHGVDGLQEHCATVAFFGHWWDLEQYEQFIDRVGPMRQLQAGKDRAVNVYHIVARKTVDQVVMARRESKRSVQSVFLDYMKATS